MHRLVPLAMIALVACDGGDLASDAGAGGDASGDAVRLPASPQWECPAGWSPGDTGCVPAAASGCAPGEAHFVDRGCAVVGRPCPGGDGFPDDLPSGAIHVRPGGTGDGSRAAPLGSIADALALATAGGTVALAPGEYDEAVRIPAGVTLRGACASATTLRAGASVPGSFGIVNAAGTGGRVEDVRLAGDRPGIWLNGASGAVELTAEGVIVEDAYGFGIGVGVGAVLHGRDLVVRRTRLLTDPDSRAYGVGVLVSDGAIADVDGLVLEENHSAGAMVLVDGEATLRRVAIRRSQPDADGAFGRGLTVEGDATAILDEAVIEESHDCGVTVSLGAAVELRQTVVRDTLPRPDGLRGCGVSVRDGATLTLSRAAIVDNRYYGAGADGSGTRLVLEDTWISGTAAPEAGTGVGLVASGGASASLTRARLDANVTQGLLARQSTVELADVEITGTESSPVHDDMGRAIEAQLGAAVSGARVRLSGNRDASVAVFDPDTSVVLEDVLVADTRERACAETLCPGLGAGVGAMVSDGARLELDRFVIERSALAGAQLVGGTLSLRNGEVRANPIGLNLLPPDVDLAQVQEAVRFVDNERNVARESLGPPPTPAGYGF